MRALSLFLFGVRAWFSPACRGGAGARFHGPAVAPEEVTELSTEQEKTAKSQRVSADDPLPVGI
jgi:hypothetical protein